MAKSVAGIIKENNKFLLGKRKPGGSIGGKWEFPGGKVENNESDTEALKREFEEELNVKISVDKFITEQKFSSKDHSFTLNAYYVKLESKKFEMREHDEFNWLTLSEIKEMLDKLADSDKLLIPYL